MIGINERFPQLSIRAFDSIERQTCSSDVRKNLIFALEGIDVIDAAQRVPTKASVRTAAPCVDGPPLASGILSVELLVGAAMCPTCWCGTYSRWP
jgi:hypothetical protein